MFGVVLLRNIRVGGVFVVYTAVLIDIWDFSVRELDTHAKKAPISIRPRLLQSIALGKAWEGMNQAYTCRRHRVLSGRADKVACKDNSLIQDGNEG